MAIGRVRTDCARRTAPSGRMFLVFTVRVGDGGPDRGWFRSRTTMPSHQPDRRRPRCPARVKSLSSPMLPPKICPRRPPHRRMMTGSKRLPATRPGDPSPPPSGRRSRCSLEGPRLLRWKVMREAGVEPARLAALEPKSSASASFATLATGRLGRRPLRAPKFYQSRKGARRPALRSAGFLDRSPS